MAWRLIKNEKVRRFLIFASIILGIIAGVYSWDQARESALEHDQNQQIILYDMGILLDNQRQIVENQKVFMRNGTLADIKDITTDLAQDYNDLLYSNQSVNPITGQ